MVESFDLRDPKTRFNFVFQLYNFVSSANEDSRALLQDGNPQLGQLSSAVAEMNLPSLTSRKKRKRDGDGAGTGSPKKPKFADTTVESELSEEPIENAILSDVALMEELKLAGCTISPEVDGFRTLLPVRVFFPCKGRWLTSALS